MSTDKLPIRQLFSERLKLVRKEKELSSAGMAGYLGFSAPVYSRYENGRIPDADTVAVIAEKCGKSVGWLLGQDSDAAPTQQTAELKAQKKITGILIEKASTDTLRELLDVCAHMNDAKMVAVIGHELAKRVKG
jgi:transcriptional regulator with XRE-family HTH domain